MATQVLQGTSARLLLKLRKESPSPKEGQEARGVWETGGEGAGSERTKGMGRKNSERMRRQAGEICEVLFFSFMYMLEYFQKQVSKILFDLHLASSETSDQKAKKNLHFS